MSISVQREGEVLRVLLEGELGIAQAASMYAELGPQLDGDTELVLDARGLRRVDGSIAQLVYFLSLRVRSFKVEPDAAVWSEAWTTLGLDRVDDDPT